jgi:hypothetical protein
VQEVRRTLAALVRRIEYNPDTRVARVLYRVSLAGGAKLATPRGTDRFLTGLTLPGEAIVRAA